uniref:TOG domain-containing protein n=1 Tax=Haemonchus placei TaxID=6290 RepID=A0A0N4X8A1_HAEPC
LLFFVEFAAFGQLVPLQLMSIVMDILNVFVSSYHDNLGEWLQFLLLRLLHKSGIEILPTQPLNMALKAVRTTFRPELQLIAICKNIQDPIQTPPVKVKGATLNYLHELLQGMEQGASLSRDEVRAAVHKIFQWMEDPKNVSIKVACERVIYDFFSLNTADFSTILSSYPPQWREFAYSLLKKNKPRSVRNEQNHALQTLQQMVSEGSLTTWEENFKPIILHIFNVLAVNDITLKRSALKLLTKICVAQATKFYDLAEMTLFKVLDSISEEENPQLLNVADECLRTLATHFPLHVVIRATKPIINDNRVGPALKMLTRLIESLDVEELTARLPEIAPGVVNCYSNPQSSVRKSTVFCLVAMVNKLGREPVNPYLAPLSNSKVSFITFSDCSTHKLKLLFTLVTVGLFY